MYTANVDIMSGITKKIIDAKLKEVGIQGEEMGKESVLCPKVLHKFGKRKNTHHVYRI